ncbi:hypothetical protein XMIN_92 [Xanthomonas citri pv. mangiferaeindicae LMG 941]|nr:hypothetical protein XMIN_92 [Xanthomonas citri pv. mangiferaeindicae LMG 941]
MSCQLQLAPSSRRSVCHRSGADGSERPSTAGSATCAEIHYKEVQDLREHHDVGCGTQ